MKRKKWFYFLTIFILACLCIGTCFLIRKDWKNEDKFNPDFNAKKVYELCTFSGYRDMTIKDYRNKFAQIADKDGILPFLDSLKLDSGNNLSYGSQEEQFIALTLIPLTADEYFLWKFSSSIIKGKAVLDYEIIRTVLDPEELTVGEHILRINGIRDDLADLVDNIKSLDNGTLQDKFSEFAAKYTDKSVEFSISGTYYDDMGLHVPANDADETNTENETVSEPNVNECYKAAERLLNLGIEGYKDLSVKEFDNNILKAFNETPSLVEDFALIQQNGQTMAMLANKEQDFLFITLPNTVARNIAYVESVTTGTAEKAAVMGNKRIEQSEEEKYCLIEYRISFEIADRDNITVKTRDEQISAFHNKVNKYIAAKNWTELYNIGENGIKISFTQIAAACSTPQIKISLDSFHTNFESNDMTEID